jgi:uncharacterized protein YndB with AHSA1/START domain
MKKQIAMERTLDGTLGDVWELWTTREGIESWWGPEGFETRVARLELRVGGALEYSFTAVGAGQIAFMQQAQQPLTQHMKARYTLVQPKTAAAWQNLVEFIPGITPYEVETRFDLKPRGKQVHMIVRFDAMHDDQYTQFAEMGWREELNKLERRLATFAAKVGAA